MSTNYTVPSLSSEANFFRYLQEIKKFPSLEVEEEYMLAKRYKQYDDREAAHKLVTSHLKLVAKIAVEYKGYGLPMVDLVSEGNIGLMQAVKKFDPELGFRLSTYAMWWIKASMQEFVLKSWSLVKIGTTAAQKKLFFNLKKMKNRLLKLESRTITDAEINQIASELNVTPKEVRDMDIRMGGMDISLNKTVGDESEQELIELIPEDRPNQENIIADKQDYQRKKAMFEKALGLLNDREKDIIHQRRLQESPATLDDLSKAYKISRERVRQIESRAMEKLIANVGLEA